MFINFQFILKYMAAILCARSVTESAFMSEDGKDNGILLGNEAQPSGTSVLRTIHGSGKERKHKANQWKVIGTLLDRILFIAFTIANSIGIIILFPRQA